MIFRWIRRLALVALVAAVFAGLGYAVVTNDRQQQQMMYNELTTLAVQTAIAGALFDATRTAEAPLPQYRLVRLGQDETLAAVAERYQTTVEVLRMANGLLPTVTSGSGQLLIVPEGVTNLQPPRRLTVYTAVDGDTLASLARFNNVPLDLLQLDNPVLAARGVIPGDIVFIPTLL